MSETLSIEIVEQVLFDRTKVVPTNRPALPFEFSRFDHHPNLPMQPETLILNFRFLRSDGDLGSRGDRFQVVYAADPIDIFGIVEHGPIIFIINNCR